MRQIHTITLNPVIDLIYEVDGFEKGTTFRAEAFHLIPAGKGLNVSNVLASMGEESHVYAPVGWKDSDLFGDACRERGVYFHPYPGVFQTRRHCTILESRSGSTTHVQVKGDPMPLGPVNDLIDDLSCQIQPGDWVVFSGSIPPSVSSDIYAIMIALCRKRGAKILLDTSGEPLRKGIESTPDLLKVNQLEAEELTDIPVLTLDDACNALRILRQKSAIPTVVISLGKLGLAACAQGDILHLYIPMEESEVRDTVGCGDAMVAGLLYGLIHGFDPEAMFRYGIACASAAAMQIGPGSIEWSDMERMLERLCVNPIECAE